MLKILNCIPRKLIVIEVKETPAYCMNIYEKIDGKPWNHHAEVFLKLKRANLVHADETDRKTSNLACKFFLTGDILY